MPGQATIHLPPAATEMAVEIDRIWWFIYALSIFFFVLIVAFIFVFLFKYRRRSKASVLTDGISHNYCLEIAWTLIPTALFLLIFFWGFRGFLDMTIIPANIYEINVTAMQWNWTFQYPNGKTNDVMKVEGLNKPLPVLTVPAGRNIALKMTSLDVIHSLFIPDFRLKWDVLPNRYSSVWFNAREPGEYDLYCAEYCGQEHSRMLARVHVLPSDEFDQWVKPKDIKTLSPVERGEHYFKELGCIGCHSVDGKPLIGPALNNLYNRKERVKLQDGRYIDILVDDQYLLESMITPQKHIVKGFEKTAPMNSFDPNKHPNSTQEKLNDIIEYIKDLKSNSR